MYAHIGVLYRFAVCRGLSFLRGFLHCFVSFRHYINLQTSSVHRRVKAYNYNIIS